MSLYPFPATLLQEPAAGEDTPPVAGHSLWLDVLRSNALFQDIARTTAANEADQVASWYDPTALIAAERSNATQRPYAGAGQLEFDGLDDNLEVSNGLGVSGTGGTIVIVGSIESMTGALFQFSASTPGISGDGPGITRFSNTLYVRATNGIGDIVIGDSSTARRVFVYRFRNDARSIWINGTQAGSYSGNVPIASQSRLLIGLWYGSSFPLQGTMSACIVYPFELTDGEIADVTTWATTRHGI